MIRDVDACPNELELHIVQHGLVRFFPWSMRSA